MNKISFKILACPESNDSEIRILIDEVDILGADYLGLDPPYFFDQSNFDKNGELLIGRCSCGCEGCNDLPVDVQIKGDIVQWTNYQGLNFIFNKELYLNSINIARADFSWEDINRTAERLATAILKNSETRVGYRFDWASARIHKNIITLSYNKNLDQKLFYINWDGQTETDVQTKVENFLHKEFY